MLRQRHDHLSSMMQTCSVCEEMANWAYIFFIVNKEVKETFVDTSVFAIESLFSLLSNSYSIENSTDALILPVCLIYCAACIVISSFFISWYLSVMCLSFIAAAFVMVVDCWLSLQRREVTSASSVECCSWSLDVLLTVTTNMSISVASWTWKKQSSTTSWKPFRRFIILWSHSLHNLDTYLTRCHYITVL